MGLSVLLVEDHVRLAANLRRGLIEHGHHVKTVHNGTDARQAFQEGELDVVLLDLGLPDVDGCDLIPDIRRSHPQAAILIASARDRVEDRVRGLALGADDYLTKPVSFPELLARIAAVQRRIHSGSTPVLAQGPLQVEPIGRRVWLGEEQLILPPREFDLLVYFMQHPDQVISRSILAREVWRIDQRLVSMDNMIDVSISRLREHLKPFAERVHIQTVRGMGYVWKEVEA